MLACGQSTGSALHGNTFPIAIYVLSRHRSMFKRKTHVIGNEEIQVPIAVVIEKTASRAPTWLIIPKAGRFGHISKRSISVIAIEAVLPAVRAKNIFDSVVVVGADTDARGPSRSLQPGLLRDVGKCAVAIIFVKPVGRVRRISSKPRARQ